MLCFYKSGIFCLYPVAMLCICHVHCSLGLNKDYHFYNNLSFISLSFLLVLWKKNHLCPLKEQSALYRTRSLYAFRANQSACMLQFTEQLSPEHMKWQVVLTFIPKEWYPIVYSYLRMSTKNG